MRGTVTRDRVPVVEFFLDGREWRAVIDTGFNGYLELPESLRGGVNAQFIGYLESALAAGQTILEENYRVEFLFDGEALQVEATFAPGDDILIGTSLLRNHRLEIDFRERFVLLDKSAPSQPVDGDRNSGHVRSASRKLLAPTRDFAFLPAAGDSCVESTGVAPPDLSTQTTRDAWPPLL